MEVSKLRKEHVDKQPRPIAEKVVSKRFGDRWYKVIRGNGFATCALRFRFHSLPRGKRPSKWYQIPQEQSLVMCRTGFHVTQLPRAWCYYRLQSSTRVRRDRIYRVEVAGAPKRVPNAWYAGTRSNRNPKKIVVRAMRLLYEVKADSKEFKNIMGRGIR